MVAELSRPQFDQQRNRLQSHDSHPWHPVTQPPLYCKSPPSYLFSTKKGVLESLYRMSRASARGPAVPIGSGSCSQSAEESSRESR